MLLTILLAALPQVQTPPVTHADRMARDVAEFCSDNKLRQAGEARPKVYLYPWRAKRIGDPPVLPRRTNRLGELPPGGLYLTVDRHIGRCHYPTLIRDEIGTIESESERR